jgi:hypothetical protein
LATEARPGYVDEALFDDDAIVATTRDVRSVGEMLFDVDYLARQLLMDVDGDDAARLLRGWPGVVAAAADVWSVLPVRRIPVSREPGRHMDRLAGLAEGIETSLRTGWPGVGATDPRMTQITETLTRAARLVERYAGEIPLERPLVRDDIAAARTRIMHGLYATTHAVNVALHQHGRDRYFDAREAGRRIPLSSVQTPYAVAPTSQWIQRMAVCEKAAGAYLHGRFTQALTGEAPRPLEQPRSAPARSHRLGHPGPPHPGQRPDTGQRPARHPHPGTDRRRRHGPHRRGRSGGPAALPHDHRTAAPCHRCDGPCVE